MSIARYYRMNAATGQEDVLGQALQELAVAVRAVAGCEGCELLRGSDQPGTYIFIEKWTSIEAHKAGGASLPKDIFKPVMAALAGSPEAMYLEYELTV